MTASSLSISLAQLGQRGEVSSAVTPIGLSSSSSSSVAFGLALTGGAGFLGGAFLIAAALPAAGFAAGALTAKTWSQPLQRTFLPTAAAGTVIFFSALGTNDRNSLGHRCASS